MLPPSSTLRLFHHYDERELHAHRSRSFLIARLLEEGDTRDLQWLAALVGEEALADWLQRRGRRQLTRRSRLFWEEVLGVETPPAAFDPAGIWPL